jgi:hypothetical protein
MNRREALTTVSFLFGGTIIGAQAFLSGCSYKTEGGPDFLTDEDITMLNEIGETIIPTTASSPGAKAANVGEFMRSIVSDCYSETEKKEFTNGLAKFRLEMSQKYGSEFMHADSSRKQAFLLSLENAAKEYSSTQSPDHPKTHYYSMIKQLTVWGFLSSEVGATKALRHVAVPGRYEGCVPLLKGEKAWG